MEGQVKELKDDLRIGLKELNKLETRPGRMEGRLTELRETLPAGLKRLRMSLDEVREFYAVQRRLIEQRHVILEANRGGTVTRTSAGDESRGTES